MTPTTPPTCPFCGTHDTCEFVFARHNRSDGATSHDNPPSDVRALYLCEDNHVFATDGELYLSTLHADVETTVH